MKSLKRVLLAAAVLAVVAGSVIAVVSASQPLSFGWVAYAPLSGAVFDPNRAHIVAPLTVLGLAIAVLGLCAGAFWAGLTVGARTVK
jgi:heme/copper-type cytochrome/quinol oxidase subunit 1